MASTRAAAHRARAGDGGREELHASVASLFAALLAHNRREEELLRSVTLWAEGWGPTHAAAMTREHAQEHERLQTALTGLPHTSLETAGVGIIALIALLREHIDREEEALFAEGALRDDAPTAAASR